MRSVLHRGTQLTALDPAVGRPEVLPLAGEPALPTSSSSPPPPTATRTSRARLAALLVLLPLAFYLSFPRQELDHLSWLAPSSSADRPVSILGASCPVQSEPKNVGPDWRPEQDDEYKQQAIERLQGAVRIVRLLSLSLSLLAPSLFPPPDLADPSSVSLAAHRVVRRHGRARGPAL